jgi:hypothetical protein
MFKSHAHVICFEFSDAVLTKKSVDFVKMEQLHSRIHQMLKWFEIQDMIKGVFIL